RILRLLVWSGPLDALGEDVERALAGRALGDGRVVREQPHADGALAGVVDVVHGAADLVAGAEADRHDPEALGGRHHGRGLLAAGDLDVLADDAVVLRQQLVRRLLERREVDRDVGAGAGARRGAEGRGRGGARQRGRAGDGGQRGQGDDLADAAGDGHERGVLEREVMWSAALTQG